MASMPQNAGRRRRIPPDAPWPELPNPEGQPNPDSWVVIVPSSERPSRTCTGHERPRRRGGRSR